MDKELEQAKAEIDLEAPQISEIIKGSREVDLKKYGKVILYRPSFSIVEAGDRISSSIRLKLLKDKDNVLPTEKELRDEYAKRGVWTEEDDEKIKTLREKIILMVRERRELLDSPLFESVGKWIDSSDDEAKNLFGEFIVDRENEKTFKSYFKILENRLLKFRKEHRKTVDQYNELFSGTIESFANFERQLFYCTVCYKTPEGAYVWNDVDSLRKEELAVFEQAVSVAMKYFGGVDSEELTYFFDALLGE